MYMLHKRVHLIYKAEQLVDERAEHGRANWSTISGKRFALDDPSLGYET